MSERDVPPANKAANSVFFLAELPYHELLRKRDPQKARKLEARMQQVLGEAVYLNEGEIIDSVGPRMIATMPSAAAALEAARQGKLELMNYNRRQPASGDVVEPTLVVHVGPPVTGGSPLTNKTVGEGLQILRSMQPMQLLISEPVLRETGRPVPPKSVGEISGVRFYEPEFKEPERIERPERPSAPVTPAVPPPPVLPARKKLPLPMIGAGAGVFTILIALALIFLSGDKKPAAPAAVEAPAQRRRPAPVVEQAAPKKTVSLSLTDARLRAVEPIVRDVLTRNPGLEVVPSGGTIEVVAAPDPANPKSLAVTVGSTTSPLPTNPNAAALQVLAMVAEASGLPQNELTTTPQTFQRFVDAVRRKDGRALHGVITADPRFVPALRVGMDWFASEADPTRRTEVASKLVELYPEENATRRQLVQWLLGAGRISEAIAHVNGLLRSNPLDADALATVARLSLSAADPERFQAASRLHYDATGARLFHQGDMAFAQGNLDAAARTYYEAEREDPQNAALALKIGRIAVLRHSMDIADLELEKLSRLDPDYGYPLLQAYIHAERREPLDAEISLKRAAASARTLHDLNTSAAEIFAILGQHPRVMESVRNAFTRGEATLNYSLTNPLLRYLDVEPDYQSLKAQMLQRRSTLRSALQEVKLNAQ